MIWTKRFAPSVLLAMGCAVSLAAPAAAELRPAGNYQITTVTADAFVFNNMPPYTNASVFVEDIVTQAKPQGGSSTTSAEVDVSVNFSSNGVFGFGCSILANPADFTANGVTGASLHTTGTGTMPCNNFEPPIPAGLTVDATWTGTGNVGSGRTNEHYDCGGYSQESLTFRSNGSAAFMFQISALPDTFTGTEGFLASSDQRVHAQGVLVSTCFQPGEKGAGPGPQGSGSFILKSQLASFSPSFSDQPSDPHLNMFVNRFTNTVNPQGGPPSTTGETDVFVAVSGSAGFGFACFVLQPTDVFMFNSDLSSAQLHMSLSTDAKMCQPAPPFGFPFLPADLDVTWGAIGPVATIHTDGQGACGPFSAESSFIDTFNHANATATYSYFQGQAFNGSQSFLGTQDHTTHIQGVSHCPGGK